MNGFEYAQARLQARYGARPDAATWAYLHGIKTFPAWLEAARQTPLKHWVHPLHQDNDTHVIESALRRQWHDLVAEIAVWMPQEWRGAVDWCGLLCDLPTIAYLLRDEAPPPWMQNDPAIKAYAQQALTARRHALLASPRAAWAVASEPSVPLRAAWLAQWRKLWPQHDAALEQLATRIEAHVRDLGSTSLATAGALHSVLQQQMQIAFRRHAAQPAAVFAFLVLTALDLEQLRAELTERVLFPWAEAA